jgi:hypothetical protein
VPMFFKYTEGNISYSAMARDIRTWRGRRPHACMEAFCTGIGRPCIWPYEIAIRYALKIPRE